MIPRVISEGMMLSRIIATKWRRDDPHTVLEGCPELWLADSITCSPPELVSAC